MWRGGNDAVAPRRFDDDWPAENDGGDGDAPVDNNDDDDDVEEEDDEVALDDDDEAVVNITSVARIRATAAVHVGFPHGMESVGGDVVSVYLKHLSSDKSIDIEFGFAVKDFNHYNIAGGITTTLVDRFSGQSVNGYPQFIPRQQVLSHLVHGTLVVEVRMRTRKHPPAPFFTENPSTCKTIRDLFMDKESADVMVEVGGGKQATDEAGTKSIKTSPTTFYAHHAIVKTAAPQLAELCWAGKSGSCSPIHLPGVTSDIFHHVLSYIYGIGIPQIGIKPSQMKEIIEAADRFGLTNLKLEAEARFVTSASISLDNVMEHLLFAESKNCALVKEAVMDFIVENKAEILEKKTLMDAPAGHMNDILAAITRGEKEGGGMKSESGFCSMRISELRGRAHARGLDIDGTRETLISALESAHPNSKLDRDDLVHDVVVDGCGVPEVNGVFRRDGSSDGVPKYTRRNRYRGREEEFSLYRCTINDSTRRWYISIVPMGGTPGSLYDTDLYHAAPTPHDMEVPPRTGWACIPSNGGLNPPPRVFPSSIYDEEHDSQAPDYR